MGGCWRRPARPFQVNCVLAAGSPSAAISQKFGPTERAGPRPLPGEVNLVAPGERLNANSMVPRNPSSVSLNVTCGHRAIGDDPNWRAVEFAAVFDSKRTQQ